MAGSAWWNRSSHIMMDTRQKEEKRKGSGQDKPSPHHPPVTCFFQLGPTFYFLSPPNTPSYYEPIMGLTHWLGESPQDQITSQKPTSWQPLIHEPMGDISYPNPNTTQVLWFPLSETLSNLSTFPCPQCCHSRLGHRHLLPRPLQWFPTQSLTSRIVFLPKIMS
jgi:hypothetical protein